MLHSGTRIINFVKNRLLLSLKKCCSAFRIKINDWQRNQERVEKFRFNGPFPWRYMLAKSPLIASSELEPAKILG